MLTLEADSSRRSLPILALVVMLLIAWAAWFTGARVAVYAASESARLEIDRVSPATLVLRSAGLWPRARKGS